jgi:hypothetical protein
MLKSTSMFKVIKIIYDDGSFAVAKGKWDGKSRRIGMRWYEEDEIGYPQTYGKSQWFVLPKIFTSLINMYYINLKSKLVTDELINHIN